LAHVDSGYAALMSKIAGGFLIKSLDKRISKNAEGYIKADFARLFPDQQDKNPLPASFELTVREDYCTIEALTQLKERLEARAPYIISEVALPSWIHPELKKVKAQDCIFHFKT